MQQVQELKAKRMEWQYYTNKAKKRKIDRILHEMAMLFANCENTPEARQAAKQQEIELLNQIATIDVHFAESCGWDNPNQFDEDSEPESVLRLQALDLQEKGERWAS